MRKHKRSDNIQANSTTSHHSADTPRLVRGATSGKKDLDWIGIGNMIISLLVGVVLASYFNIRNEQLQVNIVSLQAKLQGEYNSANLQITCPHIDCTQAFKVTNTGFGEAKSVNIVIAISSIPSPWTSRVNTIEQFRLSIHPLSAPVHVTPIQDTSVNALPGNKNNAYMMTLDNLGAQSSIIVNIYPDNLYKSPVTEYKQQFQALLYYPIAESHALNTSNSISEIINDFMDSNFFSIANFTIDASCSTCSGDTSYARYPSFEASTNNNNFLVSSNFETFLPTQAPQTQNGIDVLAISYIVDYMIPGGFKPVSIPSPLYIQVNNYGTGNQSILECQVASCSKFSSG